MSALHLSPATAIFVVDWCQFGPSWIFGLKMELMACAGLVGGTGVRCDGDSLEVFNIIDTII